MNESKELRGLASGVEGALLPQGNDLVVSESLGCSSDVLAAGRFLGKKTGGL